jgi:hypothetical protein
MSEVARAIKDEPARRVSRRITPATGVRMASVSLLAAVFVLGSIGTQMPAGAATTPEAGGAQRQFPGASGTIAAITGTTLEVQSASVQTAVTYTPTTTFEQTVPSSASAVTDGSCISAFGKPTSSAKKTKKAATNPSGRGASGPVTATLVTITQPTSGTCAVGFGGGTGFGGRSSTGRPSGTTKAAGGASRPPAGGRSFGGGAGGFGAASGTVTSVSGSKVTVSETNPGTKKKVSVVVTLTSTTAFTTRAAAAATDLAVGKCAQAIGTADTTGAITARSISLSTAGSNGCTSTAGGFGGGRSAGGPGPRGTTGA